MSDAVVISDVGYTYPGAASAALEAVSLTVRNGERLGILGPNGGGKSTLLRLILGLIPLQQGSIAVCGTTPQEARQNRLIGYVSQRPELELSMPLSCREVVELAAAWQLAPWRSVSAEVRRNVDEVLRLVGAADYASRPIGSLSGGQLQRVLIARALVCKPRILALDEPMVGIDAAGQRQFAALLGTIHKATGITMLTVTHDLRAIAAGSDQVACLAQRLHSHGSPRGLTPEVLGELFSHDVAGLMGELEGVHVHAHGADESCPAVQPPQAKHTCCDHKHHSHVPPGAAQ
jgi:zinc transport system ATP-binding protein